MQHTTKLQSAFNDAYQKIENLQNFDRYQGAFIFGSYARGEHNENSDLDVIIMVDEDNACQEINHPVISGLKLDITFRSYAQIQNDNNNTLKKGERVPMIAESIIVFDKQGKLTKLHQDSKQIVRKKMSETDFQLVHFMVYHSDDKAKRNLITDKPSALLAMGININEILKFHYQIHGHWWVSDKRLLPDLRIWDRELAYLVEQFVATSKVKAKYKFWSQILDHVTKPLGGRKQISAINCHCAVCQKDLKFLTSPAHR